MDKVQHERRRAFIGVMYAEDFDQDRRARKPAAEVAPEPKIVEPVFTAAELEAARAESREAGRIESEHGFLAARVQLLSAIASGMADAHAGGVEVAEATAEAVARTMLSALAAILPGLCAHHGADEVRALARALLPRLADETRITVRVHPLMIPALTDEIGTLDHEVAERVVLIPTEQIPPGDVRIGWQDGSAVRDAGRIRAAVEDALARLGLLEKEMIDA
jgi:flagellar biosynthesis/type III secretory pathway protein FliH